jgi:hypothetical protein
MLCGCPGACACGRRVEKHGRATGDLLQKVVGNLKRIGFEVDGVASSTVFSDLKEKMERNSARFEALQGTVRSGADAGARVLPPPPPFAVAAAQSHSTECS